jgi:hypothetical protein
MKAKDRLRVPTREMHLVHTIMESKARLSQQMFCKRYLVSLRAMISSIWMAGSNYA